MSNNQPPDKKFSLRDEMKRRKTAELNREIAQRQQTKTQSAAPVGPAAQPLKPISKPAKPADRPSSGSVIRPITPPPPDFRRTTVQAAVPDAVRVATKPFQNLTRQQKITLTAVGAAALIVFVLVGSLVLAGSSSPSEPAGTPSTPTLQAMPLSDVDSVIRYFKDVGVPILGLRPYDLSTSQVWHAKAGYQFTVQRGNDRGDFILLGYDTAKQAEADVFGVLEQAKYKKWNIQTLSNITLISPPETAASIQSEMLSHFQQYLFAPYRPYWPTSTPVPSLTPIPSETPVASQTPTAPPKTAAATKGQ
jgi:hypothetical protein